MGQKVNPHGLRVGVIKDWDSKWFADKKNFSEYLIEDHKIREFIKKKLYAAGISKIVIERSGEDKIRITASTARPGMVIGRSGAGIDELRNHLAVVSTLCLGERVAQHGFGYAILPLASPEKHLLAVLVLDALSGGEHIC